jgi:hypothetical protein
MTLRYAVIDAGNGGTAMAAELSLLGRDFVLVEMPGFEDRLKVLREAGGVVVESRIAVTLPSFLLADACRMLGRPMSKPWPIGPNQHGCLGGPAGRSG